MARRSKIKIEIDTKERYRLRSEYLKRSLAFQAYSKWRREGDELPELFKKYLKKVSGKNVDDNEPSLAELMIVNNIEGAEHIVPIVSEFTTMGDCCDDSYDFETEWEKIKQAIKPHPCLTDNDRHGAAYEAVKRGAELGKENLTEAQILKRVDDFIAHRPKPEPIPEKVREELTRYLKVWDLRLKHPPGKDAVTWGKIAEVTSPDDVHPRDFMEAKADFRRCALILGNLDYGQGFPGKYQPPKKSWRGKRKKRQKRTTTP